jgi:hypothetical protein
MEENDNIKQKLIDLLTYNLNTNIINNIKYDLALKIYDKQKNLDTVIEYITENLLDMTNNISEIIMEKKDECKYVKSYYNNITNNKKIEGYEKMLILLNYYNMSEQYDKEMNFLNKDKDLLSISYKFFDINVITNKNYKKNNINILKDTKIKICNIVLDKGERKFTCHGFYDNKKFIKFDEVIDIPYSYIYYINPMLKIKDMLKSDILKEPIQIYKNLSFIEEDDCIFLFQIIDKYDNICDILVNIENYIKIMCLKLDIKKEEIENKFKNKAEFIKDEYQKDITSLNYLKYREQLRNIRKEYYLKLNKNTSIKKIYGTLLSYLQLKSKYLNCLNYYNLKIITDKIPNNLLDQLINIVNDINTEYSFDKLLIENLKLKIKEGLYYKIYDMIINYYTDSLEELYNLKINQYLYNDKFDFMKIMIKRKLEGIYMLLKNLTFFIISMKDDKLINNIKINNSFQRKFEVKIKEEFNKLKLNDSINVFQLFKYKGMNNKTAFFIDNNKKEKIIPIINTNIKSSILINFKNELKNELNDIFDILLKKYIKYDNYNLKELNTLSNLDQQMEGYNKSLKKYNELNKKFDFISIKYNNKKNIDNINNILINYIIYINLKKYISFFKKYKQNIDLLKIAIYEINHKELLNEDKMNKDRINKLKEKQRIRKLEEEKLRNEKLEKEELRKKKLAEEELRKKKLEKEELRKKKLAEEELRKKKLEKEELRKKKLAEEELRKKKLEEEKIRKKKLAEEKLRKRKLEEEKLKKKKKMEIKRQKKLMKEIIKSIKNIGDIKLMNEMFNKYKLVKLNDKLLINEKDLLNYLNNLNNQQKSRWSILEGKMNDNLITSFNKEENKDFDNKSDSTEELFEYEKREWMFINRHGSMFAEAFTTEEIIQMYIRGDIYFNTPIKNLNWNRGSNYIELRNTIIYDKLPDIYRKEHNLYYNY